MSLLPVVNKGADSVAYFMENIGGPGLTAADAPCIKGTTLGAVRVGNTAAGVLIRGDTLSTANRIAGGQTSGGSLTIGNSTTSFQNVVLTDGATTVNTPLTIDQGFGIITDGDVSCGGDLVLANGATGKSISGYYSVPTAALNCPDATDTVVPNPAGLTQGYYIVAVSTAVGGQNQQQVSSIAYRTSGGLWAIGGCCSSIAGAGRFGLNVSLDRTTMVLSNSTGVAQNGCTVYFSKLMN